MHAGNGGTSLAAFVNERNWVGYQPELRNGIIVKVAYDPLTGKRAATDDPRTWGTHDEAHQWATAHGAEAGVALMLGPIGDAIICGIDLHGCINKETRQIAPWAQPVIGRFSPTYTEVSPSGGGLHLLFRLQPSDPAAVSSLFNDNGARVFKPNGGDNQGPNIGIYGPGSYLTVTWETWSDTDDLKESDLDGVRDFADHGPGNDNTSQDDGREARAKAYIANLKLGGATFDETREALFAAEDDGATAGVAEWARANEPELERLYKEVGAQGSIVMVAGVEKRLVDLNNLNDRFALLQTRRAAAVYVSRRDYMPIKEDDFRRRLANEVVQLGVDKTGKPVFEGAYKFWTGHARRHVFQRIAFTSEKLPDDTLNLFRGFGVVPKAGACTLICAHIHEVICAGDAIAYERMLDLMSWQIQNVGKPSRIIVILMTEGQQAGKGIVLLEVLLKIYGDAGFIPNSTDQVLGRFNDALVGRVYIFLDEVMFVGDRKAADALKSLATTTWYGIETKGLPIVQCPVGVNLWAATNHDAPVYIEEKDARYWVLKVSEHRIGDHDYFAKLMKEIDDEGREAFAHLLLNRDVSKFVPMRDIPKDNAAKREMVRRGINPYDARKWLEECCTTKQLIGYRDYDGWDPALPPEKQKPGAGWANWTEGKQFYFRIFANAYTEWQKTVKSPVGAQPTPIGSLGEVLTNAGFGVHYDSKSAIRVMPDPDQCLAKIYKPPKKTKTDSDEVEY
jgi:hypothetical protein